MSDAPARIRIDKWLWQARFFKTRGLSAKVVQAGHCRVNGLHIAKPAFNVGPGDVLTFPQGLDVRVIRIVALGTRRGPAPEAQTLYEDLAPPPPRDAEPAIPSFDGGGRPTKKDRRKLPQARTLTLD
ncbi:RNA-binding S4 domain-containing protein [Mesobacterium sp. TK19101]|uniref:RNA-binding S4 domain-containing protein n=1 Tax=Mesobacterium hydrothermale TaxID=3111907 RepID=A0ABU6HBV5_9RHOB|nr:RNA-binding S4 domain-containing protein [Mesobacterium sp. TK19101]MEC3859949.1 RNA-binding S4 domain-containing protein [Mesobacterium sp. TK19101]